MCYNAILPTTIKANNADTSLLHLVYILNRWRKMIKKYEKLDSSAIPDDFNFISKIIKSGEVNNNIRSAVRVCRDIALAYCPSLPSLYRALGKALRLLCEAQEDALVKKIKKKYANQGMTERYRPLSKKLRKEKIRQINKELIFMDIETDSAASTRLVRRIVEKRAAQTVYKNSGKIDRQTNRFRQSVRRASSFSLYNATFIDFEKEKRFNATHWKVVKYTSKGVKRLKAKKSYISLEDALLAAENYMRNHPEDPRRMDAYLCAYCGKWHIGHAPFNPDEQHIQEAI